ncbi:glycosyltransferase family 2 protein [Candidatus Woesearchaeota archaeon]|nr:glycosyltransferase family 2 protein [Candidatus Woesearchaeota archaeon]
MPTITLCMIVKDEEEFLERCLNSIKEIIDEIIIVDTGSKDRTVEIARKFTDKIFFKDFNDDFSELRNFSINKATKEWILVLDADEMISKNDLIKIKQLIQNNENLGYAFIQRTYFNKPLTKQWNYSKDDDYEESKSYLGWIYRGITRLFQNNKGIKFIYPIHETIIESIKHINGKILNSKIPIHHYGLLRDKDSIIKKNELYKKILINKIGKYKKLSFETELKIQEEIEKETLR